VVLYTLVVQGRRWQGALLAVGIAALTTAWVFHLAARPAQGSVTLVVATLGEFFVAGLLAEFVRGQARLRRRVRAPSTPSPSRSGSRSRGPPPPRSGPIYARELHDVVAHAISVIVVNAEGAKLMRHNDPGAVDRTLDTVSRTGRAALGELRRLLEVLHDDEAARSPQPSVADLTDLVARAGAGRAGIALDVVGDPADLPASAALQTYRIVQEALTNLIKHTAPDASARVDIDFGSPGPDRVVRIEVANDAGTPVEADRLPSSGHGLAGMRQRRRHVPRHARRRAEPGRRFRAARHPAPSRGEGVGGMTELTPTRVLICDDQELMRVGLRMVVVQPARPHRGRRGRRRRERDHEGDRPASRRDPDGRPDARPRRDRRDRAHRRRAARGPHPHRGRPSISTSTPTRRFGPAPADSW